MRSSPFTSLQATIRIAAKAVVLLLIVNGLLLATGVDPSVQITRLNTWWLAGIPGDWRLIAPNAYVHGQMPLEGQLAAHEISYKPKAPDEFRVVVLGDSAQWGTFLNQEDTFTWQLTERRLQVNGKRLVAFNMAYPGPSIPRDLIILDAVAPYQPDLVIWFVEATGLTSARNGWNDDNRTFMRLNQPRVDRVLQTYHQEWLYSLLFPKLPWYALTAVHTQDALPIWLDSLSYPFLRYTLIYHTPYAEADRIIHKPIKEQPEVYEGFPGLTPVPNESWQFLLIGQTISQNVGGRLLLINEPMFAGSGPNSDKNYNSVIARGIYDQYHTAIGDFAKANHLWYADLWDAIPPDHFNDTPFHADASGWKIVTDKVSAFIQAEYTKG